MSASGPRVAAAAAALLLLAGCSGGSGRTAPDDVADPLLPGGGRPLATAVPTGPCPSPPPRLDEQVEGLVLPEGAYLTDAVPQGPLVQVKGWAEQTPLELRAQYEGRGDVEVLTLEDEVVEVEVLVSDGERRTYLRGTAVCATASRLDGLVSLEPS